ncbi:MAG: hypothetical protein ACXAC5_12195 [Promethearchaeota archaeon]|jgi:predicted transcriptional regulator
MTPKGRKYKKEGLAMTYKSSKSKNRTSLAMLDPTIKAYNIKGIREIVFQDKTLQAYWYILTRNRTGVREIQKVLKMASPETASYQINKLVKAGIISKNEENGKYYIKEDVRIEPKEKITVAPVVKDESDLIEKKRVLRRWKQSFGYYCLHPEKFRFGLRDL